MALSKQHPAEEETNLFFVYGALMRGRERADFIDNPDKARFIGAGKARGTLDAGAFSGMREGNNGNWVAGELHELFDPEIFFETLDLIEGCWPGQPERSLCVRKIISVTTNGGAQRAWAYVFNQPPAGLH